MLLLASRQRRAQPTMRPMRRCVLGSTSQIRLSNFLVLLFVSAGTLLVLTTNLRDPVLQWGKQTFTLSSQPKCSPDEYANGTWVYRPYTSRPHQLSRTSLLDAGDALGSPELNETGRKMSQYSDALKFTRYHGGCASSREYWWHLGADPQEMWDRFPDVAEWEWVPGKQCRAGIAKGSEGLRDWDTWGVIKELVEGGGWLLIGGTHPSDLCKKHLLTASYPRLCDGEPLLLAIVSVVSSCHCASRLH
jgi:hypothetical protein